MNTNILKKIHNTQTWFDSIDVDDYFSNQFEKNTIGTFKVPTSTHKRFPNLSNVDITIQKDERTLVLTNILNIFISAIVSSPKGKRLKTIPFLWLEEDTQWHLRQAAMEAVQNAVLNKTIWERVNSSSLQTNTFSVSTDLVSWILSADVFGQFARHSIEASGITEYEWVEENVITSQTPNGNIRVIGKASLDLIKELSI